MASSDKGATQQPIKPKPSKRNACVKLVLVPPHTVDALREIATAHVRAGTSLQSMFRMRCRAPRGYGAPRRRNSCVDHVLLETHQCVLSRVFPRQRGRIVDLGNGRKARRYTDVSHVALPSADDLPGPAGPLALHGHETTKDTEAVVYI
jgi:hypothetical protein